MRFVFKAAIAMIIASAGGGQFWMHGAASAAQISAMHSISRKCPALAIEARAAQASQMDAIMQRDAYWRGRIVDGIADIAGIARDSCRSERA